MEYLLGALTTFVGISVFYYVVIKSIKNNNNLKIKFSQSRTYDMLAPFVFPTAIVVSKKRQSTNHLETTQVRVLIINNKAYWIRNNTVYVAEAKDGIIVEDSTKTVDTMGMSDVELEEMMFIIDRLTEGKSNDYRGSGDSQL